MFQERVASEGRLVTAEELQLLCVAAVPIFQAALGTTPSQQTSNMPEQCLLRWGPVQDLFAARIRSDGKCYLDNNATPIGQPELLFVADWPLEEALWRSPSGAFVWPAVKDILSRSTEGVSYCASDLSRMAGASRVCSVALMQCIARMFCAYLGRKSMQMEK
jgi:hypothetical protein